MKIQRPRMANYKRNIQGSIDADDGCKIPKIYWARTRKYMSEEKNEIGTKFYY